MVSNGVNGHKVSRPLRPGIFAPIPTFFLPDTEDLDIPSFETHVVRLAKAGVGPLLAGSMGEAHHLSHSERVTLIKAARSALDAADLPHVPVIAGTGAGSTRETLELTNEAAAAGADYSIVITSGYYAGVLAGNKNALKAFFTEVSEKSPIPVIAYNYPGASGGINLDSDILVELATECPNLAGVKLTCGDVGKLTRVCATVSSPSFDKTSPRKNPDAPFLVLGGFADFILPSTYSKGHGAIIGLANVAPYATAHLQELSVRAYTNPSDTAALAEAQRLQGIVARGDYTIAKASIAGTKYLLEKLYGYGGAPRKPLPPISSAAGEELWVHPDVQDLVQLERQLSGKAGSK
ncbi:dihydrodipicolinate synthetase [Punctularia strigosozonata HHB-11173 SS5]|uniref:dihydrodipicolinate synthetase n=1 Tax=Punctularia strigosozonata (strain HHB-11173) TaxID=741275 RepID=UPI0004418648|nr:dihydrodipicolinate synthetase [Punctularia strigosozonata HHB-11173 SS5]EIN07289.1 dihydrodipicolinate synthetase [Punctularia strigosozonata HHB-11173 SS5]